MPPPTSLCRQIGALPRQGFGAPFGMAPERADGAARCVIMPVAPINRADGQKSGRHQWRWAAQCGAKSRRDSPRRLAAHTAARAGL